MCAVLFALADTLAAHSMGGFKVGLGFLRKCRMRLATADQLSTKVRARVRLGIYILIYIMIFNIYQ